MENLGKKCRERDRDHDREMARPGDTLRERTGKLESEAEGPRVRNREAHRETSVLFSKYLKMYLAISKHSIPSSFGEIGGG